MKNGDTVIVIDTETTDMIDWKASVSAAHQPELIQLGAMLIQIDRDLPKRYRTIAELGHLVTHERVSVSTGAYDAHGLSEEYIKRYGYNPVNALNQLTYLISQADLIVCHNTSFDLKILRTFAHRYGKNLTEAIDLIPSFCTMKTTSDLCKIPNKWNTGNKWPKLEELHNFLMGYNFEGAHDALSDVRATVTCLVHLPILYQYTLEVEE